MSIAIVLAAIVILAGIVVVASGRGGELARPPREDPYAADFESAEDVARYRPPAALLGYQPVATEQAFFAAGRALAERDAEIAWLRGQLRLVQPEGERQDGTLTGFTAVPADDGRQQPASEPYRPERTEPAESNGEPAVSADVTPSPAAVAGDEG